MERHFIRLMLTVGLVFQVGTVSATPPKGSVGLDLDQVLPYIATGAGWTTSVTIVNPGTEEAIVTMSLFDENGQPVSLNTSQLGEIAQEQEITVPPQAAVTVDFLPTAAYQVNWAYFDTWDFVSVTAKLRYSQFFDTVQYGRVLLEHQALEVSSSAFDNEFTAPFNTRNGDDTLYLVNPREWSSEAFVNLEARGAEGGTKLFTIKVPPGKRVAVSLQEAFGTTDGGVRIVSSKDIAALVLDLDGCSFTMEPAVPAGL